MIETIRGDIERRSDHCSADKGGIMNEAIVLDKSSFSFDGSLLIICYSIFF